MGGRWRNPHTRHRLASKPNFHPSLRSMAGASGRSGSGRRGGSRCSMSPPGQEHRVGEVGASLLDQLGHRRGSRPPVRAAWTAVQGSVVRRTTASAPSATSITATTWPGRGPLEHVGQRRPPPGRPRGCRPEAGVVRGHPFGGRPRGPRRIEATARACSPVTIRWSTSAAATPACSRASVEGRAGQGDLGLLPEAVLPLAGGGLPRHPPPVEELVGGRRAWPSTSATPPSGAKTKATAPSPPWLSSAPPGRPVRRSASTARAGRSPAGQCGQLEGGPAGAHRPAQVVGPRGGRTGPRPAWTVVALVLSR